MKERFDWYQQMKQMADKICFGNKVAKIVIPITLALMTILIMALNQDLVSDWWTFQATKSYPSKYVPFFWLWSLHYGIAPYCYILTIGIAIIVVTILLSRRYERNKYIHEQMKKCA